MYITCLDMEGVLVPEIWIAFAEASGIPALKRTTRDEPDYHKLMEYRLGILREHGLGLREIQATIAQIDPLPGARAFLDELRSFTQVLILSDTFEQFAQPLMKKLNWPTLFCNTLEVAPDGAITGFRMRCPQSKLTTVKALQSIGYDTIAAGDSYNDLGMIQATRALTSCWPPSGGPWTEEGGRMRDPFDGLAFRPADILLPQNCDYTKWSVVACDQYTSQPEYWQEVEELVGSAPSTLRLILPESCLDGPSVETDIMEVNNTMTRYLREERFRTLPASLIYVERRLDNLRLRRGLVGMVDLEQYDYEPGAEAQVRATEGTVMARIPPRVAVRKNAPLELPHVMLLADDPEKTVLEPLSARKDQMEKVYDFDLMERGGHIAGWRLDGESMALVAAALRKLADPAAFRARYGVEDKPVLLFAVGDGNHSLATAKECYERQKKLTPREQWDSLPARYALCELVNLHDASLEFEPIHRVVFGVEPERVVEELLSALPGAYRGEGDGHVLRFSHAGGKGAVTVPRPEAQLEVGTLQPFLDAYVKEHGGSIDYIHGADVARDLAARPGNIAFLLPAMGKEQLFPTVIRDGVLPRKTFSMGEAHDKRFYLEARKIR